MAEADPLSARYAQRPERGVLRIWRREVGVEHQRVRQIGRIADLHSRMLPAGRGPWMARVNPPDVVESSQGVLRGLARIPEPVTRPRYTARLSPSTC